MSRNGRVIVAMSGGVDSSVSAALLHEQGYECVGVFMRVGAEATEGGIGDRGSGIRDRARAVPTFPPSHVPTLRNGCCSAEDALDARAVAGRLGIPLYVLNFEADFERIIEYFVDEYAQARTPNPCIMCNSELKFGKLLRYADMLDAEFVATGHYARVLRGNVGTWEGGNGGAAVRASALPAENNTCLARALNLAKDQSYVLFGIRRANLGRCLFPLGEIADKAEVRRTAVELGLKVHDKPESQEICFVPDGDYKELVRARRPETARPGEVHDIDGNVLGRHEGIVNYTIGQRRGLRIAAGTPIYVTRLDADENSVTVGPSGALFSGGLVADNTNWLTDPPPAGQWQPAEIKIRHQHTPTPGRFRVLDDGTVQARFDQPQPAVTPGQAAVFYRADGLVLGGGWIVTSGD